MVEALIFAAAGFVLAWSWRLLRPRLRRRLPVSVTIDHAQPQARDVAGYLATIAARLDERPERMRVVFDSPQGITLDLETDSRLAIHVNGQRPYKLDLRQRWIADHPTPLPLKGLVIYIDPVDANRFRVNTFAPCAVKPEIIAPLALMASAGLILALPSLTGLAGGLALGFMLPGHLLRPKQQIGNH